MLSLLTSNPFLFVLYMAALVVAITVHEFAHARAADQLGDPNPASSGSGQPQSRTPFGPHRRIVFAYRRIRVGSPRPI